MLPFDDRTIRIPRKHYLPLHNRGIPIPKEPSTIGGHLRKRRLELGIRQSEAADRLNVSLVTLSKWECDKIYPAWVNQDQIAKYLGFDPFTDPTLGSPKSNEPAGVAFLSPGAPLNIGKRIIRCALELRKTRKEIAKILGISPKTLWNWETQRRKPNHSLEERITQLLLKIKSQT